MIHKTYNPIIRDEEIKLSLFPKLPIPGPNTAILMMSTLSNSAPLCITQNTNIRISNIRGKKYNREIEIDMQPHDIRFENEYISLDNISKFTITITASAAVTDPESVYMNHITDVCGYIEMVLTDQIQECAGDYSIGENRKMREELKSELSDVRYLESGIVLRNISIGVKTDESYQQLLSGNRDIQYRTHLEKQKAKAGKEIKGMYGDHEDAIFAGIAAGKIDADDAFTRIKTVSSNEFDENLRKIKAVTDQIKELELNDMISNNDARNKTGALINGMVSSVPNLPIDHSSDTMGISDNHGTEDNRYRPIEDDDED